MIIRPSQREVFSSAAWRDYRLRLCNHIRSRNLPACDGLPPGELERRVDIGIDRARRYRLDEEQSIATFVALMFAISPAFDHQPAIAAALRDPKVEPNTRMQQLTQTVDDPGAWKEAAAIPGESVWETGEYL